MRRRFGLLPYYIGHMSLILLLLWFNIIIIMVFIVFYALICFMLRHLSELDTLTART